MQHFTLNTGHTMPIVGFGTWDLRGAQCQSAVLHALQCGYRLIDTAQMYENEREVGLAIAQSGVPRQQLFVTTKLMRASYAQTRQLIDLSIERLGTGYIDLLLVHEPYRESPDMWRAMAEAVDSGEVRAIGISNFNEALFADFVKKCGTTVPAVNQVEAHLFFSRRSLLQAMLPFGTVMQAWSPLVAGQNGIFANATLAAIAQRHGKTPAQIALRHLVEQGIGVVPKSSDPRHIVQNLDILDFSLTAADRLLLDGFDTGRTHFGWTLPQRNTYW